MKAFKDFAENTKHDYMYVIGGLVIVTLSSLTKTTIGPFLARLILFIGVLILAKSLLQIVNHVNTFFAVNPNFSTDINYAPFRKNIYGSCFICFLLLILIIYTTYTVFF